jgi:putative methyltransferase (TIGR04325 family)
MPGMHHVRINTGTEGRFHSFGIVSPMKFWQLVDWMEGHVPGIKSWHSCAYQQQLRRVTQFARRFHGVYTSFDKALKAADGTKLIGYDNPQSAQLIPAIGPVFPSDYPVLFWMRTALESCHVVFDLGGHVGVSYYAFHKYLDYPAGLSWIVYDLPSVVLEGINVAKREDAIGLSFTTRFSDCDGANILLASGSLQFLPESFDSLLKSVSILPAHILVNRTPLSDHEAFVTLQDTGPALCPYRIFHRETFVHSVEALGYELVDSWKNPDFTCYIPFHSVRDLDAFTGLYFRLKLCSGSKSRDFNTNRRGLHC